MEYGIKVQKFAHRLIDFIFWDSLCSSVKWAPYLSGLGSGEAAGQEESPVCL